MGYELVIYYMDGGEKREKFDTYEDAKLRYKSILNGGFVLSSIRAVTILYENKLVVGRVRK